MTKEENNKRIEIRNFLEKIVIDAGVGRMSQMPNFEEKALVQVVRDIAAVTGQKAQIRRAKKSVAGFKIREGQIIGVRVTLRRAKMVDFFERLITIVLPRVRDFNGLNKTAIDDGGVLNVGIRDHYVFPEIEPEQSLISFPLGVSVVPKIKDQERAREMFAKLGVPMKKKDEVKAKAKKAKTKTRK